MTEPPEKSIETDYGEIRYHRTVNSNRPCEILFIHGLGADKKWFSEQYPGYGMSRYAWIVPDLLGFGESAKPDIPGAYTMAGPADLVLKILLEKKVRSLAILAHPIGGPVAACLMEKIALETDIRVHALFYLEGNLDENDAYLSGKFAAYSYNEYQAVFQRRLGSLKETDPDLYRETKAIGPLPFWASSVDLVRVSKSGELLPRIIRHPHISLCFVFGNLNKGRFTSEALVTNAGLAVEYIPDAGHMMYLDAPQAFWPMVFSKTDEVIQAHTEMS